MSEIVLVHNVESGEIEERAMNKEELATLEKTRRDAITFQEQVNKYQSARQSALAKLAALGLTEEEIAAL